MRDEKTLVEIAIIRALCKHMREAGWPVRYAFDGYIPSKKCVDDEAAVVAFLDLGEVLLLFGSTGLECTNSWVKLIPGNAEDVLSDWSVGVAGFTEAIEAFVAKLESDTFELEVRS